MRPMSPRPLARWLGLALLLALSPLSVAAPADEEAETVSAGEAEFDEIDALKKKAATEGDWALARDEQITVAQRVFTKPWNKPPFDTRAFDYTPEQMKEQWPLLMRAMGVPYPSPEYLRARFERFPAFRNGHPGFNGDYEKLSADTLEVWRLFYRGDYQQAMQLGEKIGVVGRIPGKLAQIMYAIYLEPNLEDKHMLLQDAANVVREYSSALDQMKKEKTFHQDYIAIRIGYAYSIGRIAEDVPVAVAIRRNYVFKVLDAVNDVLDMEANHPLGLAFRAGVDANIVRKVGKATGRVTFGAKQTNVKEYFERATTKLPDVAVLRFEYGNALLYMDKKRQIDTALEQFRIGASARPRFAMEALDSMYAAKRRKEIEALAKYSGSFRSFERKRLKYQKESNINLYCVLPKVCPPYLIQ